MRVTKTVAVAAALMVLVPGGAVASTAPGALDKTFSGDGRAQVGFGGTYDSVTVRDVVVLPTEKLILAAPLVKGDRTVFGVTRLRVDGRPDSGFSGDGRRSIAFTGQDVPRRALAVGGGNTLVGGSANGAFALAMVAHDGSLNPTFGDQGKVVTDLTGGLDQILDIQLGSAEKFLVAGVAGDRFAVARYASDGTLDPTFGNGGVVVTTDGFPGSAYTVRLQPDGKLLVGGTGTPDGYGDRPMLVSRYDVDGKLDPTFGQGGRVNVPHPVGEDEQANALLVDPQGRILAGGTNYWGEYSRFCLVRLLPDGTPDPSFGSGGSVVSSPDELAHLNALAIQRDGRIIGAGQTSRQSKESTIAVTRYTTDGAVDSSFSGDGVATVGFPDNPIANALAVGVRDDTIVAVGERTFRATHPTTYGAVVRLRQ